MIAPKHDKIRVVQVSPRLMSARRAAAPRAVGGVPSGRLDDASPGLLTAIAEMYARAELTPPPHPIHSLRHSFGTTMAAAGVPLPVLQELMGHADVKTTRRYVHVNERQKRDAIASVWERRGSKPVDHALARDSTTSIVAAAWQQERKTK